MHLDPHPSDGEQAARRGRLVLALSQPRRGPAQEVRQRDLGLLDRRVPALLPLVGDEAVVAGPPQQLERAAGREVAGPGEHRRPRDAAVGRASLVLQVHVAHEAAERREARLRLFPELGEGVGRVPDDADPLRAGLLDERARGRRRREVAVRLEPDLDAGAAQAVAQRAERLHDPFARRREVRAGLDAVAEHADARSAELGGQLARARRLVHGGPPRGRVRAVEEGARVDAGNAEPGVGEPRARLAQALAHELGARPERVVVLQEAQLDAVVAHARAFVDHAREAPRRAPQGRKAESHQVILSSIRGVTRVGTRRPAKKRSRPSSTTSAIARRTSLCAAPTCGVSTAPRIRRSGCRERQRLVGVGHVERAAQPPASHLARERAKVDDPAARDVHDRDAVAEPTRAPRGRAARASRR